MTSSTNEIGVRAYVVAVAARLADLPEEERKELIEDLEQHLREVDAEDEGMLIERLGTPEAYADELRVSAGLPERRSSLRRRIEHVKRLPVVEELLRFLPELRPGWWILRAFIVAAAGVRFWTSLEGTEGKYIWLGLGEIHVLVIGGVAALLLSVPSVMLGRASSSNRAVRWVSILGNVVTVLVGIMLVGNSYPVDTAPFDSTESGALTEYLHHEDGTPIANICAYTGDLEPIKRVFLFDQDGQPIDNPSSVYDGTVRLSTEGLANAYPHDRERPDPEGGTTSSFVCPTIDRLSNKGANSGTEPSGESTSESPGFGDLPVFGD